MNTMAFSANNAGRQAASHGHFLQRNARFVDPWKVAAGKVAQARLEGNWGLTNLGARQAGPAKPLGRVSAFLLRKAAETTVGTKTRPGPAQAREGSRYHLPQEYQPQVIEEQQQSERGQTQPFEREVPHSPWGNLSRTQFLGDEPGTP